MRHRRTAALLAAKRLFDFADFGALQVANFLRDAFERCGHDRERGEILRVAVAFDHLRSDRRGREAQALRRFSARFPGRDACRCPPRRKFFRRRFVAPRSKARGVAAIFRVPVGDFQAESDRLGVNAVRAADFRRVLEFPRALFENFAELAISFSISCEASRTSSACAVSTTSLEVRP